MSRAASGAGAFADSMDGNQRSSRRNYRDACCSDTKTTAAELDHPPTSLRQHRLHCLQLPLSRLASYGWDLVPL